MMIVYGGGALAAPPRAGGLGDQGSEPGHLCSDEPKQLLIAGGYLQHL